jgi:hypothetical protein
LDNSRNDTQTFSVSETGYSGAFTVPASCTSNGATVATIYAGTTPNTYVVTPVAAGACTAEIGDGNGNEATLSVGVTTTTIGGQ